MGSRESIACVQVCPEFLIQVCFESIELKAIQRSRTNVSGKMAWVLYWISGSLRGFVLALIMELCRHVVSTALM